MRGTFTLVAIAALFGYATPAAAQERTPTDSLVQVIRRLEARIDSLQRVVEALLRQGRDPTAQEDELAALRAAAQTAAAEAAEAEDDQPQQSRTRNLQILNPEISVTGDVVGNFIDPSGGESAVSATPREFEFSFQAALDPYTRTKVFVTHEQDFEIAGFPEEEGEEGGGFEIEEGYLYWVGLPGGVGVKLGKFRQEIGLYNRWHTHALLEVERPLASIAFLGEDGLIQTGGSLTLPSVTIGRATQTAFFEVTAGANDVLFAGANEMTYLGRIQSFWDFGTSFVQLGVNGVYGRSDEDQLTSRLASFDFSYRWAPPQARFRGFQFKAEWYLLEREVAGVAQLGNGGYAQANLRLGQRWIAGVRADYLNDVGGEPKILQYAPSITWWQSEWVRVRLQYNHLRPVGGPGNHTVLLQTVWAFGPHKHESY